MNAAVLIAVAHAVAVRPERFLLLLIIGLIGAALPLSSAWRELRHPRDAEPLTIDANYRKEDRFFATSFETRVSRSVGPAPREPGPYAVVFRDPEVIDTVAGSLTIERGSEPESIVDIHEDLNLAKGARLRKEALVGRDAHLGASSSVRAVKSARDIYVERDVVVERWIDAGRTIRAEPGSDLGVRATALGSIVMKGRVTFRFLAAPSIFTGNDVPQLAVHVPEDTKSIAEVIGPHARIRADGAVLIDGDFTLPPGVIARGNVIARGSVTIGEGATLVGSIHSDRDIAIENEARVTGSIVAERNLSIGAGAAVDEHVMGYGTGSIRHGARIGLPGKTTTLLAGQSLEIARETVVYGRVITYGEGRTI